MLFYTWKKKKESKQNSNNLAILTIQSVILSPNNHKTTQPILFPKLRIKFADFPYLLSPNNKRLFTLETWCGLLYVAHKHKWRLFLIVSCHSRTLTRRPMRNPSLLLCLTHFQRHSIAQTRKKTPSRDNTPHTVHLSVTTCLLHGMECQPSLFSWSLLARLHT